MDANNWGVVVGYDGSPGARLALDWAAETAKREGKPLTILHALELAAIPQFRAVDPVLGPTSYDEMGPGILDQGLEQARAILGDAEIKQIGTIGSPAAELVNASQAAELVVTGSRGRGRLMAGLLGSTAYTVTAHASCPAVVVRAEDESVPAHPAPERRVLVGIDDSEVAERAVDEAARIAELTDAPLHIVTVAHAPSMESWAYAETAAGGTDRSHDVHSAAEQLVATASERVAERHPGLQVNTDIIYGDSGRMLAEFGVDAGLIVVGSRGRGGFVGSLLGSVSHAVIHHATCPVMVVR